MCHKCVEAVRKHLPKIKEEDIGGLLISATSYPFGGPNDIEKEVMTIAKETDGTIGAAMARSDSIWEEDYQNSIANEK